MQTDVVAFISPCIMLNKPELILIDLDGTLVDSVPDLAFCVNALMETLGRKTYTEEKIRDWVGNGIERFVRRSLVGSLDGEPEDALLQKAFPIFMQLYAENTSQRSMIYPGVIDGLNYMQTAGYPLACITNKAGRFTNTLLEDLGLRDYFELVVSGDTLPKKKPDPLPLLHAAKHFDAAPSKCLMIGDSINDVQAARAAGFQIAGVTYGYNHGRDIRETQPDLAIDSLAELVSYL
ncbi:Phosphoglycolate phosphatase [hydrothermal vent metagenome]|uniref:phosphoglycolate phosphatase n=1 Tax=hydrothermal vent metagenome TaxID=652676 RepID=A0A3B1BYF9_9ZZZZ